MNIAIQMEIKVRELEARSLLALAAAERGHRVLVGDIRRQLLSRPQDFAPGIFHDKSLTPSPDKRRFFAHLAERGWALTSQDEEHWLNLPDFAVPAERRFSAETLATASRSFAWGQHESDALRSRYPEQRDRIIATGSPRVDLWRPELRSYHTMRPLPGIEPGRPFVLISSNFSFVLDVNPFWVRIRDKRRHYVGLDDAFEFDRYDAAADKQRVLKDFVRAVRHLAATRPELLVVVRPHPIEAEGAWEDLIGPVPNVLITRERSLNAWIRGASVVIQNGCTSGYESAVGGVPLISFHPRGILAEYPVNMLGLRASDIDELDVQLDRILAAPERWAASRDADAAALLSRRLHVDADRLSADLIVDEWERIGVPEAEAFDVGRILRGRRAAALRRAAGSTKRGVSELLAGGVQGSAAARPRAFRSDHKFPPIGEAEVRSVTEGLRGTLGRFRVVSVRRVAPDLLLFEPRVASRP
jgi:surface carbohydrate biosynthesis protein